MILLGFLAPTITDIVVEAIRNFVLTRYYPEYDLEGDRKSTVKVVEENGNGHAEKSEVVRVASKAKQTRVLIGVLLGDFMHNLADGIVIGTAFKGCNSTMGWTITAATVYHELAQEISDYLVLTDPAQGNLKPFKALFLNFITGTSALFLFCLGCVGIGLVLLAHEHCVPGGGDADADP